MWLVVEAPKNRPARLHGGVMKRSFYEPDSFIPLAKLESAAHIQRPDKRAIHPKKVASLFKTAQTDSEQKEAPAHASQAQAAIETEVKEIKPKDFAIFYYQCDQIGAPQELTDEQGHIVWAADYKVWGRTEPLRISATGTDDPDPHDLNRFWPGGPRDLKARSSSTTQALNQVEQNLRFQGQYFDHESGLHYNRFRYYDPQTGRFVHQDPIGLLGGENLFAYGPNPITWLDPLGLSAGNSKALGKAITSRDTWSGRQAHHKVPGEAFADNGPGGKMLQRLQNCGRFKLDGKGNGIMLPEKQNPGTTRSKHRGYHAGYNEAIIAELDDIATRYPCPKDQAAAVQRLQTKIHEALKKGNMELYGKGSASKWSNFFKSIRK